MSYENLFEYDEGRVRLFALTNPSAFIRKLPHRFSLCSKQSPLSEGACKLSLQKPELAGGSGSEIPRLCSAASSLIFDARDDRLSGRLLVSKNCHPEIAFFSQGLYQHLRDLHVGAFIHSGFGKGNHPSPWGRWASRFIRECRMR